MQFNILKWSGVTLLVFLSMAVGAGCSTGAHKVPDNIPPGITDDGAWCWFSSPRAIYVSTENGPRLLTGWMKSNGTVETALVNTADQTVETSVLYSKMEKDDHDNPAFLQLADGRLMAFYSKHSYEKGLFFNISKHPGDISEWENRKTLALNDPDFYAGNPLIPSEPNNHYTYVNPYRLSESGNRIYLFWRGYHYKPNISWSDDNGENWHNGRIMIAADAGGTNVRPYVRYFSNNKDKIHILFTDGHPRNEEFNSVYYAYLKNGAFYKADGTEICTLEQMPFSPAQADKVYDATSGEGRAWVWDVAEDEAGNPVVAYTKHPSEKDHQYYAARFQNNAWKELHVSAGGKWFPQTPLAQKEPEPHYSGGISIDPNNWRRVYYSSDADSELFKVYQADISGEMDSISVPVVVEESEFDQVRPVTIRGEHPVGAPSVLWMENLWYIHWTDYRSVIRMK